jgi:uncharacterized Tic20 family protein
VWIGQRRKSRYASFQALQALGYQAFVLWVGLSVALVGALIFIIPLVTSSTAAETLDMDTLTAQASGIQSALTWVWLTLCVPGLVGAGFALTGRDFHYPILGKRLESFLLAGGAEIDEAREDDWVAGICHSSAVVIFWGMILPWAVYSTQKERATRLRFQSLQAFLFQILAVFAFGFACVFLGCMMGGVVWLSQYMNSAAGAESNAGLYLIIGVLVMLIFTAIMLLSLPTFHLFALIAWARVTRGQDYLYPIVGRMLKKKMGDETMLETRNP